MANIFATRPHVAVTNSRDQQFEAGNSITPDAVRTPIGVLLMFVPMLNKRQPRVYGCRVIGLHEPQEFTAVQIIERRLAPFQF